MDGEAASRRAASRLNDGHSENDHAQEHVSETITTTHSISQEEGEVETMRTDDNITTTTTTTIEIDEQAGQEESDTHVRETSSPEKNRRFFVVDEDSDQEEQQHTPDFFKTTQESSSSSSSMPSQPALPKSIFPATQSTSRLILSGSQNSSNSTTQPTFQPSQENAEDERTSQSLFPARPVSEGLTLSGSGPIWTFNGEQGTIDQGQDQEQEQHHQQEKQNRDAAVSNTTEQEEELPTIYPPLSELTFEKIEKKSVGGDTGLPTGAIPSAVAALPETANAQRWDTLIDLDSDTEQEEETDRSVIEEKINQGTIELSAPGTTTIQDTIAKESPLAPFLRKSLPQLPESSSNKDISDLGAVATEIVDKIKHSDLFSNFLSDDLVDSLKEGDVLEKLKEKATDVIKESIGADNAAAFKRAISSDEGHKLEGLSVATAGGLLAKSFLSQKDSGAESSCSDEPIATDRETSTRESTPALNRYTAAEKGKAVVREPIDVDDASREGEHSRPESRQGQHMDIFDDLPPINSVTDIDYKEANKAHLLSMLSPTPVSPPIPSESEQRSRIYPAAPPAPWSDSFSPTSNNIFQRRSPTLSAPANSSTGPSVHPNLAFMSSSRPKTSSAPPPSSATVTPPIRSLFTDYPDMPTKPSEDFVQPTVTLPRDPSKAPVLRGVYELPSMKTIDQWRRKNNLAPNAFKRLCVNTFSLITFRYLMARGVSRILSSLLSPSIVYWGEWAVILLLVLNIIEVGFGYFTSSNNFENVPLTASQRSLLALDPVVTKVPGEVPIFKKSISVTHNSAERPMLSSYVSPSAGQFNNVRAPFQKPSVSNASSEYRDAATIMNKSMSRSFNQSTVQDKSDLLRLMKNVEAREELQAEWKPVDTDASKRSFGLHPGFGVPQSGMSGISGISSLSGIQGGHDMSMGGAGAGMVDNAMLGNFSTRGNLGRYQPALRTTLSKDHTSKTDLQKDGLYVVGHSKVLKSLKISESQLDRWVFNMRKWMWDHVVQHVVGEMEIVDTELAKLNLSYLDCKSATMFYTAGPPQNTTHGSNANASAAPAAPAAPANSLGWGAASVAAPRLPSAFAAAAAQPQQPQLPTSLQDLESRYGQSQVVRQRMVLEMYLAIPGNANRRYVVERLQSMGPMLTHFIWNSNGVTWDGGKKFWSPELPTDAQIIMHLFTVYMDLAMPQQPSQALDRFPFTYKYYVPMEAKPDATTSLQIKQTSKSPPNYNLVVEGSMWEVVPQRLNVWYTLVLFIYMVMKENGGYIGQIYIGTQKLGLGDVVEGCDF
ncbi:hypothetical protein BGZ83_005612 [Gryganskiella cystojenkinii]|nr:hypothetical protein BGZ83_005612 [Gryganskiella cystojenkinii]